MALSLREIVHQRYGGFLPGGFSVKNDVLSVAKYDVGEQRYRIAEGYVDLLLLLTALEQPLPSVDLTGVWRADDNAYYYLKQEENGTLWWLGFSNDPDPTAVTNPNNPHGLQEGLTFSTVFQGHIGGTIIEGVWVDVPRGERLNTGRLTLQFHPFAHPTQLSKIASSGDGFEESTWELQADYLLDYDTIDNVFGYTRKNDGTSLERNLKPYKDSAALFCLVLPDPDFPDDKRGNPNVPQWHVNYPTGVDRSYKHFLCDVDGGTSDGDLNIHIQLLPQQFDAPSTFWDPYNGWNHDPKIIQEKLKYNPEGENVLHLEVIMFGRGASCGDNDLYNEPPSLPGWQEQNGNSVLLNGRPINNGMGVVSGDQVKSGEYYGTTLVDSKFEIIAGRTLLRVTGVVVLDCGHYDFPDFTPCYDENEAVALAKFNQEIHPVYAIDYVNATSSDDLSGTWSEDDDGRTFYLRQLGDNTLWGLGMSPYRDLSFVRAFQGTIQPDQSITVHWVDVPFGGGSNTGALHTGSMTLQAARPGDTSLYANTICRFVTWSDSPVEHRWTKLYDIPPPA